VARRLALVVATYEYEDAGLSRLTPPARDAEEVAAVLSDPEVAGFDVTLLVNEPHHRVGEEIGQFYAGRRRDDLLLLYFTGLGLKGEDGRLHLATTDTRRDSLPFTALAVEQLRYAMDDSLSQRKVLVLDTAFGAARRRFAKVGGDAHSLDPFTGRGCTALCASDTLQYAFAADKLRGDAARLGFTRQVIVGLREGRADLDGDGEITIDELYQYVHDRMAGERPRRQSNVEGRTVIARNSHQRPPEVVAPPKSPPPVDAVPRRPRPRGRALVWSAVAGVIALLAATTLFLTLRHNGTDPALLGEPMSTDGEPGPLALIRLDGRDVIVSGGRGVVLQLWDAATRRQIEPPIQIGDRETDTNEATFATGATELDGKPVIVTLGTNRQGDSYTTWVRVWDVAGRRMLGQPITGQRDGPVREIYAIAVGQLDNRPVIVTGTIDGEVIVWDLATRQQVGAPFKAHDDAVRAIAFGTLEGKPVIVTGGANADPTVRLWDLATRLPIGRALEGHTKEVVAVALGQVAGKSVVVSSSLDYSVRVWDLDSVAVIEPPLLGHTDEVHALAVGSLDNAPVVVASGKDQLVRIWDLATHKPIGRPLPGHTEPVYSVLVTQVAGRPVAFSGGHDNSIRAWDLAKAR
jgi:uncharacterized caspase-like protein